MEIDTVKCITKKVGKYLKGVEEIFGKKIKVEKIRELPGNRQEVTIFARRR